MLIEALYPLTVRLPDGDLQMEPGMPVDLPEAYATRLLEKLPQKVRRLDARPLMEPAAVNARPVYWETADGPIIGPATPEFLARVQEHGRDTFWVIVTHDGLPRWIRSDRLRSQRAFATQPTFRIEEPIRDL